MPDLSNISRHWKAGDWRQARDRNHVLRLVELEGTPEAIKYLDQVANEMSHYWYWFCLSTCWVKYSGWSDLALWKKLFSARRPKRAQCLMKPDEYQAFLELPDPVRAYRAHRPGETDWIAYTLSPEKAGMFALQRGASEVSEYLIPKREVIALFLRRNEQEVISLEPSKIVFLKKMPVIAAEPREREL